MRPLGSSLRRRACRAIYVAAVSTAALWTQVAQACPVCFAAKNEDNQIAFLVTTGILTFAPLLLIGGLIWWLRNAPSDKADLVPRRETVDPATELGAAGLVTMIAAVLPRVGAVARRLRTRLGSTR